MRLSTIELEAVVSAVNEVLAGDPEDYFRSGCGVEAKRAGRLARALHRAANKIGKRLEQIGEKNAG